MIIGLVSANDLTLNQSDLYTEMHGGAQRCMEVHGGGEKIRILG